MLLHDDGLAPGSSANRFTLGTRWVHGGGKSWEFGLEAATQFGDQSGNDIPVAETWAGHLHLARHFDCGCKPWARAELNEHVRRYPRRAATPRGARRLSMATPSASFW